MNNYTRQKLQREIRKYYLAKEGLLAIDDKIKVLQSRKSGVKGIDMSAVPNFGGGSRYEDSLLDIISDLDMLYRNRKYISRSCDIVEKCLNAIPRIERNVLLKLYGERCNIEVVKRHFNYEKSAIYGIANKGLEEFGLLLYGED
ncbi:hypothetical protein [Finegoldia magna]|uniref:hypothetical protein n=1 Tax=Finegoldia magna TaxID=1260 RepID=UPI001D13AF95|nr:hypothetical protein [Finegoldia magna]UEB33934.1 hypothetical protein LK404_03125 [Finegoldia magna]